MFLIFRVFGKHTEYSSKEVWITAFWFESSGTQGWHLVWAARM